MADRFLSMHYRALNLDCEHFPGQPQTTGGGVTSGMHLDEAQFAICSIFAVFARNVTLLNGINFGFYTFAGTSTYASLRLDVFFRYQHGTVEAVANYAAGYRGERQQ